MFVKKYKINLSIAKKTEFTSLNEMFTREIKKDFKDFEKEAMIHPVEGELVSHGTVKEDQVYLIKRKSYSLKELVGEDSENLNGWCFYNYYLSPKDYHRVHHPVSGIYTSCTQIEGALYPVAPWFVKICPDVFNKNYRTVSKVKSDVYGTVYIVMVGALNVGSIKMSEGFFTEGAESVEVGDHLGTFQMGSSVVVICNKKFSVSGREKVFFEKLKD